MENLLRTSFTAPAPATDRETSGQQAAVAMVLCEQDLKLLFIHRADHPQDPWSGQIALPGGKRDPDDSSLISTAQRECFEEVGLSLRDADHWGPLPAVQARSRRGVSTLWVTPQVFRLPGECPQLRLQSSEVQDALWIPLAELLRPENRGTYCLQLEQQSVKFPAWDIGNHQIWGLTYMMVNQLLRPLQNAK